MNKDVDSFSIETFSPFFSFFEIILDSKEVKNNG